MHPSDKGDYARFVILKYRIVPDRMLQKKENPCFKGVKLKP